MQQFSVVIPTYNSRHVIGRAVESVLSQTCRDLEVIVVDDGSVDDTAEVLRPYQGRIRCVQQANCGAAAARNRGIAESRGRYVAFLDADDAWSSNKLAEVEKAIAAHPDAGLFYSDYKAVNAQGRLLRVERCRHVVGDGYSQLLLPCFIQTSTVVCKRECFDVCGLFYEPLRRAQDWDMWIRIARSFTIVHVPAVLGEYTWEPLSTARSSREAVAALGLVVARALQADPALGPKDRHRIRARLAYMQGVAHLRNGRRREALGCFRDSIVGEPLSWKGYVYLLLGVAGLTGCLPHWIRVRMRLT